MKKTMVLALAALAMVACGNGDDDDSGPTSTDNSLVHVWDYSSANGESGLGVTFNADGTYKAVVLELTSSASANAQEETGTYVVQGSDIVFTPEESSCSGPDAPSTIPYVLSGTSLTLTYPTGVFILQVDTGTTSNEAYQIGCFDSSGDFTPTPLAPVSDD